MAVNFLEEKKYTINYEALYNEFNAFPIFKDKKLQERYLGEWFDKLKNVDELVSRAFDQTQYKIERAKKKLVEPEAFQQPVEYKSNTIQVAFNVSGINSMIQQSNKGKSYVQPINLTEFVDSDPYIIWTPTSDKVKIKSLPIVMIQFVIGRKYKYLVIDGNHRITDAIEHGKKTIDCILINGVAAVELDLFESEFDKLFYVFHNEVIAFAALINRDGHSEKKIYSKRYLKSGDVYIDI